MVLNRLLIIITLFFLASCVGTVDNSEPETTLYTDPERTGFQYSGIVRARAIAQNKVELEFEETYPSTTYDYYLHINEDEPIKLSLESLDAGQVGLKKYTAKANLFPNTSYKFRVSVVDQSGASSIGENIIVVTTFDNKVADFDGIVDVQPITGSYHTSARVSWVPSEMAGTYEPGPFDVKYYEITYIPASSGLDNMNVVGTTGRQTLRVEANPSNNPSFVDITTLTPDTTYYFQVRAIHALYANQEEDFNDNGTPISVNRELNTTWFKYKTGSQNGNYDFDTSSVVLKNGAGQSGLDTVRVFWKPAEGIFHSYRIFYRKYVDGVDGTDVAIDDELTKSVIQDYMNNSATSNYKEASVSDTFIDITGLESYEKFQFKVVACKTSTCKVDPETDSDSSIVSDLEWIKVEPILAPFFGINFLKNPDDPSKTDLIKAEFDSPALSIGFANKINVYCLSPDQSSYVKLGVGPSNAATGGVGNCNGLYYNETINLSSTNVISIEPVNNIRTSQESDADYCFAMVQAIEGGSYENDELPRAEWVVRCIKPDIPTPNIKEFSGIKNGCAVNDDVATVEWDEPIGGVYNKFRVFKYRKNTPSGRLNYFDAISNIGSSDPDYDFETVDSSVRSHTFNDLTPGETYYIGTLALTDSGTPSDYSDDIYSEYNLNIVECKIPFPIATFDEWTRAFAIGPRVDGRMPQTSPNGSFHDNSFIWEAINSEGIPYEVNVTGDYAIGWSVDTGTTHNYTLSPGNFESTKPSAFNSTFDGKSSSGFAASKSGVVSLAWKDVALSFANTSFVTNQDHSDRASRDYGYIVYRSDDNKATWKVVSDESGLIHAGDYSYRKRSNLTQTNERMLFFTDYSVSSLSNTTSGSERARVYWYKVIPVFNGTELIYDDNAAVNSKNLIKVTLPPPNMALVHRKMANRNICGEMDLTIDKDNNYRCDYDGLGATAKSSPWRTQETVYDFGGDLLVDRNELGCNFTRGTPVDNPQYNNSFFNRSSFSSSGIYNEVADFKGWSTDGSSADNLVFRGCTQGMGRPAENSPLSSAANRDGYTAVWDAAKLGSNYDGDAYNKMIYGDCIYDNSIRLYQSFCTDPAKSTRYIYNYPGLPDEDYDSWSTMDCSIQTIDPATPQFANGNNVDNKGLFDKSVVQNVTIQAEHLAVIYNRDNTRARIYSPLGPGDGQILETSGSSGNFMQSCFINLASIGADSTNGGNLEWSSRWVSVNLLNKLKSTQAFDSYTDKTVGQLHSDTSIYESNSALEYHVPPSTFWNTSRFNNNTKLSKIFSTNSAKLPPLIGFSRKEAQRVCSSYEVEVGFSSDDSGADYVGLQAPKSKRLLRKNEFIAASAHPETRDNAAITSIESRENNATGDCVNNNKIDVNSSSLHFASGGGFRDYDSSIGRSNGTSTFLWTGSSHRDGADNSHKCVSRYGVQDLIGNLDEASADILYCDYRLDAIYYGVEGNIARSVVIDGFVDMDDDGEKETYRRLFNLSNGYKFWENAKLISVGDDGLKGTADDVDLNTNPAIWVYRDPNSGYCSLVDNDIERWRDSTNFLASSGIFNNVFNFLGETNTTMIDKLNSSDQESVTEFRNGDGFFFNTGPTNLAPKLANYDNSLSLVQRGISGFDETKNRTGKFFNNVLGLPLACANTNGDTCGTYASDNRRITTTELYDEDTTYQINDFPIGNSQILHFSLGTTKILDNNITSSNAANRVEPDTITNVYIDLNDPLYDPTNLNYQKLPNSIDVKSPATIQAEGESGDIKRDATEFNIPRFSILKLMNGGNYSTDVSGRYGMGFDRESPTNELWESVSETNSIRCGVKINN